ncbi:RagB/SusD family nutrient uptake outer membrane protein [Draconibacterium sp. IB214405]|uniref:RagB/SusD family nutrient uptake outer membrane protein n=1 Tax=Draconibacterium sp. IB214405 TaxID=3097352 RepID=UPI002A0F34C8|nr:RagB/SusD family nutrient uptake outer membrane protein [Draconibacterium sp. IB214405]MDX8339627.1 RagB/SusD family nutrient uptake outer membrane protein [Draconibacterium sp. IB214405]
MKPKYLISTLLILLITLTNCDQFLEDTELQNVETEESGIYSEEHADELIVAIYAEFKDRDGLIAYGGLNQLEMATQDLKMVREANAMNNFTFNSSSDEPSFAGLWNELYEVIGRCNSAIEIVPQTEAPEAKVSRYNSEAKVFRALAYYHLMMSYNTCPLVLETIDPGDSEGMLTGDATREEIYSTMIADLEEAIANSNFPWEKDLSSTEKGHMGQGTARTILTYFYLSRAWENNSTSDFEKAKTYAKEIIDDGGFSLEPVLCDIFYDPYNSESIFTVNGSNSALGLGTHIGQWFAPLTVPDGADSKFYGAWFKMTMTQNYYDAMEDGDARRYFLANPNHGENTYWAPVFMGGDKYGGPVLVIDDVTDDVFGLPTYQNGKPAGSPQIKHDKLSSEPGQGAAIIVYRLADVYLLYAEACIKTGEYDEAREYINKVRERARNAWTAYISIDDPDMPEHIEGVPADIPSSVTGDELLEVLKNERRIELSAELKRVIDLRRWSLGGASDWQDEVSISGTWSTKFKWYPKPQDEIDLSQGNIIQNPGY